LKAGKEAVIGSSSRADENLADRDGAELNPRAVPRVDVKEDEDDGSEDA